MTERLNDRILADILGHVRRVMPGISARDVAAALAEAKVEQDRSLRQLERRLADRAQELLTGPNTEPWPLVKFVYALHALGRNDVARPACAGCGTYSVNLIRKNAARERVCSRCYRPPARRCAGCGRDRPIVRRGGPGKQDLCNGCYQGPILTCCGCGRRRPCPKYADGAPLCATCMPRLTHVCAECGQDRPAQAFWPIGPVCRRCYAWARANPRPCPACGRQRALIAVDEAGARMCGTCAGVDNDHACQRCGIAGSLYSDRACAACVLDERVTLLLADVHGHVPEQLMPVRDALTGVQRPASVLTWLRASPTTVGLTRLVADPRPISHELVDELASHLDVRQLRAILISSGVLAQRDERLEAVELWLERILAHRPARHALLVRPFAQWTLLRRARRRAETRPFTQGAAGGIRSRVLVALHFLTWLDSTQVALADITQAHLDQWLDEGTSYRYALRPFIRWACARRLAGAVDIPPLPVDVAVSRSGEQDQWRQLHSCLNDTAMPLDVRAAGSLLLLFGIRVSRLVQLHADHLEHDRSVTHLRVAEHSLLLPPGVAAIVVRQQDREDLRSVFGRPASSGKRWLFPGLRPGQPMDAPSLTAKLNDHGITVRAARNTALADLAADLPPPVLADLIGIGISTATRWAGYARRDWNVYLAARLDDPDHA